MLFQVVRHIYLKKEINYERIYLNDDPGSTHLQNE
jgi:hypothetical protein